MDKKKLYVLLIAATIITTTTTITVTTTTLNPTTPATHQTKTTPTRNPTTTPPQTEWNKTYGGTGGDFASSVQQTSDGGYIAAGYTYALQDIFSDLLLVKTDSSGGLQWNKTYGGTGYDTAYSVQQTSDGGYIATGETNSFGLGGSFDFWLVKTDSSGGLQWNKTYGGTGDDLAFSVQQTSDGGYIAAGWTDSIGAGSYEFWLVKIRSSGGLQWSKTYGGTSNDAARSVQQTSDGGYIAAGETNSFGLGGSFDLWLVKTSSSGGLQWSKAYGGTGDDAARSVQQTSDGGFIVAGYTTSFGSGSSRDFWLVKTDSSGGLQWNKTYGGTGDDIDAATSVQQTSDGGYIAAGYTHSFGAGSYDFWLVKTDGSGNHQWNKTYGGTSSDMAYSVQQTSDGGYIAAGYTHSFVADGRADFWLVKIVGTTTSGGTGQGLPLTVILGGVVVAAVVVLVAVALMKERRSPTRVT